ncbi:MAG: Glycine-tRNA ligase [Candidatus Levybacteria bacterium GW2011_GWA2_37_36]|nr:MAG: Glycine-tRNA ligase [Candidatus Levybacteria bacterium GW2011_GWA1_37_16]KKQ34067.1 MAG: Glycine-tRNA ligase [Candidatus Levybacteria bacterium GW2011_GWA2_37_36]KKQ38259.1 MAG: Glycine-tRNA ligase [Candidatus Levybacteria bacterium GW2011_GWC2_37_7]KKQ42328.1 MAG: Glycine-tRNA ligase [Candidatus Levybacteria bacterium GW2011_GWB1_37_8]
MDKITALCKRRGFIFSGSEIYGGLANTYDYGPAGTELLRNIRNLWWDTFVHKRSDIVGLDASVISHQEIWKASGHTSGFADAMIDCKSCKLRMRADHLIEDKTRNKVEGKSLQELDEIIKNDKKIVCPNCGKHDWTNVRKFNLLFPVNLGIIEGDQSLAYLRGETAQGMFINFKNIVDSSRVKLPFGIAQLGKSFRNEITPGNSVFRTLEFELAEIEYFFDPKEQEWEKLFEDWKKSMWEFVAKTLGVDEKNLQWREHDDKERSFYSKKTEDLEYKFPFGFKELWGLAYRTDYDLQQHAKFSNKDLSIVDPQTGKKIMPHVIEPAVGINRILLMVLSDFYTEEEGRIVLKLNPKLAPYKAAVFPLLANKSELVEKAKKIYKDLSLHFVTVFDGRGNIGKRYFAQDEVGTPFCITIDFETLENDTVTIRDRDTMNQERVKISELANLIKAKII